MSNTRQAVSSTVAVQLGNTLGAEKSDAYKPVPMKLLIWLIRIVIFIIFLALAAANTQDASLNLFAGYLWHAPLIFIGLAFFAVGLFAGWLSAWVVDIRRQIEIRRLKRELKQARDISSRTERPIPPLL